MNVPEIGRSSGASYFDNRIARRNAIILAFAMTLSSSSAIIVFTTAALVGTMLAPSGSLITLPVSFFVIGTALATVPASMLMGVIGRKPGFMIGTSLAFLGGMLATWSLFERNFWTFCLGTMQLGSYMAFAQYYRFAAADRATEGYKAKTISWVMIGGIGGSVVGTQVMIHTKDLLMPVLYAGSFVAASVLALFAFVLVSFIDIPVMAHTTDERATRPLKEIIKQPKLIIAILTGMVSYAVMNLLMTATPVAMVGCGFKPEDSAWVILMHSLSMFAPSFFTGSIIARFGVEKVIFAGLAMLAAAAIVDLSGITFGHFSVGLILLGLGWNFGFIGGTTMVTECYKPAEKSKVQALNDFAVFGTVALASLSSGQLYSSIGWNAVNYALFPVVAIAFLALIWLVIHSRRRHS